MPPAATISTMHPIVHKAQWRGISRRPRRRPPGVPFPESDAGVNATSVGSLTGTPSSSDVTSGPPCRDDGPFDASYARPVKPYRRVDWIWPITVASIALLLVAAGCSSSSASSASSTPPRPSTPATLQILAPGPNDTTGAAVDLVM